MKNQFFRLTTAMAAIAALMFSVGCTKDGLEEEGFRLHYSDVIEIAQNITYQLTPTWYGGTPADFRITEVTCGGSVYIGDEFSINSQTGVITIAGSANTTPYDYKLSISCVVDGRTYNFPDKVTVYFINGIPEGIVMEPNVIGAFLSELGANSDAQLQTAQVTTEGEHIEITGYEIRNVKFEGELVDNVTAPLFAISSTGEVSFVKGGPFRLGTYTLDIKLSTRSFSAESNVGLFADALTVNVISAPTALSYTPSTGSVEAAGTVAFTSVAPQLTGTPDGISYALSVNTEPADAAGAERISIDAETGVITFAAGGALTTNTVYNIDVLVSSIYTEEPVRFPNVFNITVVDRIEAVSGFSYVSASKKEALGWTISPEAGLTGASRFSWTNPAADYTRHINLNVLTGDLSVEKFNLLPVGQYEISVDAYNDKGESETATFNLEVKDNPYYFTHFSYGNNLGLSETQTSGVSQFRISSLEELNSLSGSILYSDISDQVMGTSEIEFTRTVRQRLSGTTITDNRRGTISFTDNHEGFLGYLAANQMGVVFVTATTMEQSDPENTFSVTVPVFVDYSVPVPETNTGRSVSVKYSPFVLRVNPATGGRGVTPAVTGVEEGQLALDYRRSFNYYNLNGCSADGTAFVNGTNADQNNPSRVDGSGDTPATFLFRMWQHYSERLGTTPPTSGSATNNKNPVAYFDGTRVSADLAYKLLYVDNSTGANQYSVYVPAGAWIYDGGYADGVFVGQMTYATDGSNVVNSSSSMFPYAIWFDKDFE